MNDSKYKSLIETLKSNILNGKYGVGKPIPSVRALIKRFGLSNTTVLHALDELVHQGLISRKQGRGTFVSRSGVPRQIGFIIPGVFGYELFPPILTTLARLSRENGYAISFSDTYSNDPVKRRQETLGQAQRLIRDRVSGVVFQPLEHSFDGGEANRRILDAFRRAGVQVVLLDCDVVVPPGRSEYDVVSIDNIAAAERLAAHMLDEGAKNVHLALRPNWWTNEMDRIRGVELAMLARGHRFSADNVLYVEPNDLKSLRRHLKSRKRPDAFVCEDDAMAAMLRQSLAKLGFDVPNDIMLGGFDDVNIARLMTPSLTTVRQPYELIAKTAFERLMARINDPSLTPMRFLVPSELVVRSSTRRKSAPKRALSSVERNKQMKGKNR